MIDLKLKVGEQVFHKVKGKGVVVMVKLLAQPAYSIVVYHDTSPYNGTYTYTSMGQAVIGGVVELSRPLSPIYQDTNTENGGIHHIDLRQKWLDLARTGAENKWEYRHLGDPVWRNVVHPEPVWEEHVEYRHVLKQRYVVIWTTAEGNSTISKVGESKEAFCGRLCDLYKNTPYTLHKISTEVEPNWDAVLYCTAIS